MPVEGAAEASAGTSSSSAPRDEPLPLSLTARSSSSSSASARGGPGFELYHHHLVGGLHRESSAFVPVVPQRFVAYPPLLLDDNVEGRKPG